MLILSKELLGYLEHDDAEGLKSMFCEISRESPTIDEEIDAALDFFKGKITSHDSIQILNPSEESVRNGKIVFLTILRVLEVQKQIIKRCTSQSDPVKIGTLHVDAGKGKEVISFEYDEEWLANQTVDSCPDRWGRLLMKRREAILAHESFSQLFRDQARLCIGSPNNLALASPTRASKG